MTHEAICNEELDDCDGSWHVCWNCGGDGVYLADCFEDSCCCGDPETEHDTVLCNMCSGKGGTPCERNKSEEP